MGRTFQIKLEANDLGQLLDGLRCRAHSWRQTAEYLEIGQSAEELFVSEECRDAEEASDIAAHYERIIDIIYGQINEQGGWRE